MTDKLTWQTALKEFNNKRKAEGGKYTIPKKGSEDYIAVRQMMGDDVSEMKPDQPLKNQMGEKDFPTKSKATGKPRSKSRTPKMITMMSK